MKFIKHPPPKHLSTLIRYFWYLEIVNEDIPFTQTYFPYGAHELIYFIDNPTTMQWIGQDNKFQQPDLFYSGQLTKPFKMFFVKPSKCVGVSFQPWAGSRIYSMSSHEFTNDMIKLSDIDNNYTLLDKLAITKNYTALFNVLEEYIQPYLNRNKNDEIAQYLTQHIIQSPFDHQVGTLLNSIGLSSRRIEQRFLFAVGLPLRTFIRKARFQKVVTILSQRTGNDNLTKIGINAGYYDQAHFIREFKAFSGIIPSTFNIEGHTVINYLNSINA